MAAPRLRSRALRPRPQGRPPASIHHAAAPSVERLFTGPVRLGKRTKHLVKRIGAPDVAIIDHAGIDRVSGEDLAATGCRCVINVAPSVSPRYSNQGPAILVDAGVYLVDMPGAPLFEVLREGAPVTVAGGRLLRD